jgi:hypothetical protein
MDAHTEMYPSQTKRRFLQDVPNISEWYNGGACIFLVYTLCSIEAWLEWTLFNTDGMHALSHGWHARSFTRWTHHESITVRVRLTHQHAINILLLSGSRSACYPCSEQKIAQFRTHYLTKELAYVSTQQSGQFDTFRLNHFSVHCNLAWLLSTHVWKFIR